MAVTEKIRSSGSGGGRNGRRKMLIVMRIAAPRQDPASPDARLEYSQAGLSRTASWRRRRGGPLSARPSRTRSVRSSRCRRRRRRGQDRAGRHQMAVDRINQSGGINGRPVELIVADYESKPDVGRRKAEKLVVEDEIDVHQGGFLSNVPRLHAGLGGASDRQHDRRVPRHDDHDQQVQPLHLSAVRLCPAQAVAFAPIWSTISARGGTSPTPITPGASRPRCLHGADQEGGRRGREHHWDSPRHRRHDPFLSTITGDFDGLFGIFFGKDGVTIGNQAFDLGLTKKYKWWGRRDRGVRNLPALGSKIEGVGINRYVPVPIHRSTRPRTRSSSTRPWPRAQADRSVRAAA